MTTITVWLLVVVSQVYVGAHTGVQPIMFPTEQACLKLVKPVTTPRYVAMYCIQTEVIKP